MVGKSIRGLVALGAMLPLFLLVACGGGSPTSSESASGGVEVTEVQPSATSSPSAEGAGASPAASPSEEASSPSPTGFADIVIDGQLTNKEICNSYKKSLVAFQKSADRRVKGAEGKTKDSYDAARFRKYNQWVKVNHQEKLAESLEALATDALNEVSNGQAGLVSDLDDYLDASIDACGLSEARSKAEASVKRATATGQEIVTKANNKPWYPKGYEEWIDGVAFKYNASATRNSYLCGWAYNVTCRDGCPNGLYVEVNFEDRSGTIVDYGNDYIPRLLPGDKALVQLRVGSRCGNVDSFSVTDVSCR